MKMVFGVKIGLVEIQISGCGCVDYASRSVCLGTGH